MGVVYFVAGIIFWEFVRAFVIALYLAYKKKDE